MMNEYLANLYGTNGAAPSEEQVKQANMELFAKLAAEQNIDLSQMTGEQIEELYEYTFKGASEGGSPFPPKKDEEKKDDEDDDDEEEDKEAAARAHFQKQAELQEKVAEADFMGRVMAHSFTQELNAIKEASENGELDKEAMGATGIGAVVNRAGKAVRSGAKKARDVAGDLGSSEARRLKAKLGPGGQGVHPAVRGLAEDALDTARSEGARRVARGAMAGTAAAGGAGYAAKKKMDKKAEAQAFEEVSARYAIDMAKHAGYDEEEAFNRVNAVYVLGLDDENTKVAHANGDYNKGVHLRALEYLEAGGYPVDWDQALAG